MENKSNYTKAREAWSAMTIFERFEQVIAIILSVIIAIIVVFALAKLVMMLVPQILEGSIDPFSHEQFYKLFGMIMTVLIAMEFKHSIIRVALRKDSIVQVKTVVLIALLALGRKFIILDTKITDALTIAALAFATLSLGVIYWLMRERDDMQEIECANDVHDAG